MDSRDNCITDHCRWNAFGFRWITNERLVRLTKLRCTRGSDGNRFVSSLPRCLLAINHRKCQNVDPSETSGRLREIEAAPGT